MTKQHFEAIADTINLSLTHAPNPLVIETLAVNLADRFEQFNPRFDKDKFLQVALRDPNNCTPLARGACVHNVDTWG